MERARSIELAPPAPTKVDERKLGKRAATIAVAIILAIAVIAGGGAWYMNYVPADLDTSTTRLTELGRYQVSYEPSPEPIPVNELHAWTVRITTRDGDPVEDATIAVDGDMPQHGHGLPTQPRVTGYLGDGLYRIEGVKFQMSGWWFMELQIMTAGDEDRVRFDFVLP